MKIKTGFVMRTVMGLNLVSGEGLDKANYTKMVKLNDSAAFLWNSRLKRPNFSRYLSKAQ